MGVVFFPSLPFLGVMLFPSFALGIASREGGASLALLSLFSVFLFLPLFLLLLLFFHLFFHISFFLFPSLRTNSFHPFFLRLLLFNLFFHISFFLFPSFHTNSFHPFFLLLLFSTFMPFFHLFPSRFLFLFSS